MKSVFEIDELGVKDAQSSVKVCMHILMKAQDQVRVMRDASTLVEAGFDVSIVDVACERTLPKEEHIDGIYLKHIIIPNWLTSRRFQLWFFFTAVRTFILSIHRLLQSQADIYHAHELIALPASFIVAKLRRKPLIFEAYELHMPVAETDVGFWRPLGGLFMRLLAVILPRCAGVIAVSPPIVEEMRNRYHLPEVSLIRNVPAYRTVQRTDRLRHHLGLGPETRIALYQGSLDAYRELDRLVRAATFLDPHSVIVLMGPAKAATLSELEALIASEGVAKRVKILPPVPYAELLDWTASADIGLIIYSPDFSLNIRWCLPNKLFEYLMAGLPVLTSQLDAIAEVIRTYDVGQIVPSLAPAEVGATINAMLADQLALARMQCNALEAAKHEFHWEKESQQLVHLYQDILGCEMTKAYIESNSYQIPVPHNP